MARRLIKTVGYGLTNLPVTDANPMLTNDSRINHANLALRYEQPAGKSDGDYMERLNGLTSKEFSAEFMQSPEFDLLFVYRQLELQLAGKDLMSSYSLMQGIVYDGEYGDPGTLLVIPPSMLSIWNRSNDSIDTIEHDLYAKPYKADVKIMPFNAYPYSGWMNRNTGERLTGNIEKQFRSIMTLKDALSRHQAGTDDYGVILSGLNMLNTAFAKDNDLTGPEAVDEAIVPDVPYEVRDFIEWTGIFNDVDTWKELRPMIYSYWS